MTSDKEFQEARGRFTDALLWCRGLSPAERQIGLIMARHANRQNFLDLGVLYCWPSLGRLAMMSGLARRAVQAARAKLRAKGAIDVSVEGGHGQRDTARYRLNDDWAQPIVNQMAKFLDDSRGTVDAPLRVIVKSPLGAKMPVNAAKGDQVCALKGAQTMHARAHVRSPDSLDRIPRKESLEAFGHDNFSPEGGTGGEVVATSADNVQAERKSARQWDPATTVPIQWGEQLDRVNRLFGVSRQRATDILMALTEDQYKAIAHSGVSDEAFINTLLWPDGRSFEPLPNGYDHSQTNTTEQRI